MTDNGKPNLHARLVQASVKIGAIHKNEVPTSGAKFNFRGIDTVIKAIFPVFNELEIVLLPRVRSVKSEFVTYGGNNAKGFRTEVVVDFEFRYEDEFLIASVAAEAIDSGDKSTTKAMSVALRVALLQALHLPTDEPDPDNDNYDVTGAGKKPETRKDEKFSDPFSDLREAFLSLKLTPKEQKDYVVKVLERPVAKMTDLSDADAVLIYRSLAADMAGSEGLGRDEV